jgi:triosephosphate isomerase
MRKKIAAGNWKMNATKEQALELFIQIAEHYDQLWLNEQYQIIIAPPFPYLDLLTDKSVDYPFIKIAAQNCHQHEYGAFTGEVSASMLASVGVSHVILGHSERRLYFHETDEIVAQKTNQVLANGLTPIVCIGEPLQIREENTHLNYVLAQLKAGLFHLSAEAMSKVMIAYEPVWAIGTGKNANMEQVEEMHSAIRNAIDIQYGKEIADEISILYGGSCNASNATDIFSCQNVDGGLIGGASLKPNDFIQIVKILGA